MWYQKKVLFIFILFVFIILNFLFTKDALANYLSFDTSLFSSSKLNTRFQKIFLVPLKRNKLINYDNRLFVNEIIYHFHKLGFKGLPFHYIVFENGDYFKIFNNFEIKADFIENVSSINIILIYEKNFSFSNFKQVLSNFLNNELYKLLPASKIKSIDDIVVYRCNKILPGDIDCQNNQITTQDLDIFNNYLISSANSKISLKSKFLNQDTLKFPPDVITEIPIYIENNSEYYVFWDDEYSFELKTQNNSIFFVNDIWVTPKTIISIKEGGIAPNNSSTVYVKIKIPLLPRIYSEKIFVYIGPELIDEFVLTVNVEDIGQKILRINNNIGFVNVYEQPDFKSNVLGKVSSRSEFIFYENIGDFYKIKFQGNFGWVNKNSIQIIKNE